MAVREISREINCCGERRWRAARCTRGNSRQSCRGRCQCFCSGEKPFCNGCQCFCNGCQCFCSSEKSFCNGFRSFCNGCQCFCNGCQCFCSSEKSFCNDEKPFCSGDGERKLRRWFCAAHTHSGNSCLLSKNPGQAFRTHPRFFNNNGCQGAETSGRGSSFRADQFPSRGDLRRMRLSARAGKETGQTGV
jgi:hypothetical protein